MDNGWVKLHRKIFENPIIQKPAYLALWVVLLLKANHKDKKMIWNNDIIVIHEGQLITGRKELSKVSNIPETTIERALDFLEKQGNIGQQKTTKFRLITILNWKSYQQTDNKRTTSGQQADTNKNVKNDKNTPETSSEDVSKLIKAFEGINPNAKRYYGIPPQRKACQDLIDAYGFDRVLLVIEKTLPKTNGIQYFPTITTPIQLMEKWSSLESAIIKHKNKSVSEKQKQGNTYW